MNGFAAFAPKPEEFIRALPNSGRVFIRALTATGENKDTNFVLSRDRARRKSVRSHTEAVHLTPAAKAGVMANDIITPRRRSASTPTRAI